MTKRASSNRVSTSRFTLGAGERIKSRKQFDGLFKDGSSFFLPPLRVLFSFESFDGDAPAKVAFSAPKRVFKTAVQRNYMKRRMREAYRHLKPMLYARLQSQQRQLLLVFVLQRYVEKITVAELSAIISKAIDRLIPEQETGA